MSGPLDPHGLTHPLCEACWDRSHPGQLPSRLHPVELERCCQCGLSTASGIYVRAVAADLPNCPDRHNAAR
jgi:hypothetical protein